MGSKSLKVLVLAVMVMGFFGVVPVMAQVPASASGSTEADLDDVVRLARELENKQARLIEQQIAAVEEIKKLKILISRS